MCASFGSGGVEVDTGDGAGASAGHMAARGGHVECILLLLTAGTKVDIKEGFGSTPHH